MSKKKESGASLAWERLKKSVVETEPKDVVKFVVLAVCVVLVYVQLEECLTKVDDPPVTTHSRLILNDTLSYPALTVCREPPYNRALYKQFNFSNGHVASYPISSLWKYFPYDKYNITDFWDAAVYKDVFIGKGLSSLEENVNVQNSTHLTTGLCHTIRPKKRVLNSGKKDGYTMTLLHDLYDYKDYVDDEPGWNVYIHEPREKFSENINFLSSRQDHVFLPVGELVEVSIDAYQFKVLKNCNKTASYSMTECEENCWLKEDIEPAVNCSGPWFPNLDKPLCTDFESMRDLIKATILMNAKNCCEIACTTTQYKAYIVKRTAFPDKRKLQSGAYIYFSSKTVITMEEQFSYNWNDFVADLGGSVGFLLGLSVLSIIGALEFIMMLLFSIKKNQKEKKSSFSSQSPLKRDFSGSISSRSSTLVAKFDRY